MALPALATVETLAEWLGVTISDDGEPRAEALLRGASTRVRAYTRRAWLTAGEDGDALDTESPEIDDDDLEVARTVVLQVIGRLWHNPKGIIHESTGPFSARWAERVAEGLYLSEEDRGMLDAYRSNASPKLWTLATTRGDIPDTASVYVDTEYPDGDPGAPIPVFPADFWPT